MPLEELLSMYGYNFEECAPSILSADGRASDSSNQLEASVLEENENSESDDSSDHCSSKTRSKLKYLRDNHNTDLSKSIFFCFLHFQSTYLCFNNMSLLIWCFISVKFSDSENDNDDDDDYLFSIDDEEKVNKYF